jgi:hypothetical protein
MRFGRTVSWMLALPALALAIMVSGPAWGQPGKPTQPPAAAGAPPSAPSAAASAPTPGNANAGAAVAAPPASSQPDSLSPTQLMNGPSLRETGRIAVAPVPMSTGMIESEGTPKSPKEKSIARAASSIDTGPAARPSGVIDARVLDREIAQRFADIAGCRVEVARAKQVKPAEIVADKLLLRWIIEPDGSIGSTDVVAIMPVDLGIMDCAKRVMSQWKFTRPRGGPMTVERPFTFF